MNNLKVNIANIFQRVKHFIWFNNEDERIAIDLSVNIQAIQKINSEILIKKILMPEIKRTVLLNDGYLITEAQALEKAIIIFNQAKINGKIDELNSIVLPELM